MPTVIPVRMHFSTQDLWFNPAKTGASKGDHVVVSTERGTEFGLATADPFNVPKNELKGELKPVLRIATDDDLDKADSLATKGDEAMPVFRRLIKKHGLDMKPVGVEFLFGGEKAVFYFAAEDRVDFRDLVHDLAAEFHQRVDMRQIGVRDEASIVGGYAPCGQELCCVRLGGQFEPVSIRMAKEQDLPLNSAKISGVCGRLMCCLRYEFEAYKDFKQRAPKKNAIIDTPLGKAKIVEYNTPRELVTLRLENGKSFTVALKDMTFSEACQKRAAENNAPLRPDTVTREALEALGTAEIALQLAELDRANDPDAYALDDSLVSTERRTPRRRQAKDDAERTAKDAQGQQPTKRRRSPDAAEDSESPRVPRRTAGRRSKDEQGASRKPATAASRPKADENAGETRQTRKQAQPRRRSPIAKQAGQEQDRATEAQAPRQTRRKHTRAETQAPQPATKGDTEKGTTERPRRQRQHHTESPAAEQQAPQKRRHTTRGTGEHADAARGGEQQGRTVRETSGQDPAQPKPRRHRKPGDKGGSVNAAD